MDAFNLLIIIIFVIMSWLSSPKLEQKYIPLGRYIPEYQFIQSKHVS